MDYRQGSSAESFHVSYDNGQQHVEYNARSVSSRCPTGGKCRVCTGRCKAF